MKRLAALLTALPLFGAITFSASKALADSYISGTPYYIGGVTQSSDYYPLFRGFLYVGTQWYYWGGSYCSSYPYTPSATDIQLLSDAVINRTPVYVYYKPQGNYRCLTGYLLYNTTSTASTNAEPAPPPLPGK